MSKSETLVEQAKAYAALKQAKSKAATISSDLSEYGRKLEEESRLVARFLNNPEHAQNFIPLSAHLKQTMQVLETERMVTLVDEFVTENRHIRELQKRVDEF